MSLFLQGIKIALWCFLHSILPFWYYFLILGVVTGPSVFFIILRKKPKSWLYALFFLDVAITIGMVENVMSGLVNCLGCCLCI